MALSRSMLREWVASGPDRHDLELYDRSARGGTENGPDEEEQSLMSCWPSAIRPSTGRQRLRNKPESKKSKEVALLHLAGQKGVAWQVGDIPGNRRNGLENRCPKELVGSSPTPSAKWCPDLVFRDPRLPLSFRRTTVRKPL
jgi:hypothetical protein